jgi:hypothetical protein
VTVLCKDSDVWPSSSLSDPTVAHNGSLTSDCVLCNVPLLEWHAKREAVRPRSIHVQMLCQPYLAD